MPRVRLILEDDNSQALPDTAEQVCELDRTCDTLNQTEKAVGKFKNTALPQMEQALLTQAQRRFVGEQKKGLTLNGRRRVHLQTLHGQSAFSEQKFLCPLARVRGHASSYLRRSGQSRVSVGLQEFCLFACTRMSHEVVVALVTRMAGEALVCPQTLCHWVQQKGRQINATLAAQVEAAASLPVLHSPTV